MPRGSLRCSARWCAPPPYRPPIWLRRQGRSVRTARRGREAGRRAAQAPVAGLRRRLVHMVPLSTDSWTASRSRQGLHVGFVVQKVYVGGGEHEQGIFRPLPKAAGAPHFWVLSQEGELLVSQPTVPLEDGDKSYDKAKFAAFIRPLAQRARAYLREHELRDPHRGTRAARRLEVCTVCLNGAHLTKATARRKWRCSDCGAAAEQLAARSQEPILSESPTRSSELERWTTAKGVRPAYKMLRSARTSACSLAAPAREQPSGRPRPRTRRPERH